MKKLSRSLEKYLFEIYSLSKTTEKVTPKMLQTVLGFNKASTLEGVKALKFKGFAEYYPHGGITLTQDGKKYAKLMTERKNLVETFLKEFLFVEDENLKDAANSIEYSMSDYLSNRIALFVDFFDFCPCGASKWQSNLKNYILNGEMSEKCAQCMEKTAEIGGKPNCKGCVI